MKKIIMFAVCGVLTVALRSMAEIETVNSYTWTYRINGDEAEIYDNGHVAVSPKPIGNVIIPSTLGGKIVTSIGSGAFWGCSGLTGVTIPDSVTSIERKAFHNCNASLFDTETIPGVILVDGWAIDNTGGLSGALDLTGVRGIGSDAFRGCNCLTNVTISDSVTSIGYFAFYDCNRLTSVMLPNSVTSIGEWAFAGCSGLMSVLLPDSVHIIGDYTFSGCSGLKSVTLPDSVTIIGDHAFSGCTELTSVTIPGSVTNIGAGAFSHCSGLKSFIVSADNAFFQSVSGLLFSKDGKRLVAVPGGLLSVTLPYGMNGIEDYAFNGCSWLTSVTIPDGVTSIGSRAFLECNGLKSVTMPNSLSNIGIGAFSYCGTLTHVEIPTNVTSIAQYAFYACRELTSVIIPDSITSIGDYAFGECEALENMAIPVGVKRIGDHAFSYCRSLENVIIPNNVTNIDGYAFYNCSGLTSVTIPDSVMRIGAAAFYGCSESLYDIKTISGLKLVDGWVVASYEFYSDAASLSGDLNLANVRGIGDSAFYGCSGLTSVTIPDSVTSIGQNAFSGCNGLTAVHISNLAAWCGIAFADFTANPLCHAHNLYLNGSLVVDLEIPNCVTNIGVSAFYGCDGLTSVTLPDSVTSIGDYAFSVCSGIRDVTVPQYVCTKSLSSVFPSAYQSITNVVVLNGVISIGERMFYRCSGLTKVTLPDSVTSIGRSAFADCRDLMSIMIPNNVMSIGDFAFDNCWKLASVAIPPSVISIGRQAFCGCNSLKEVHISDISAWCRITFADNFESNPLVQYTNGLYINGEPISGNIVLPSDLTAISYCLFTGCTGITGVTIPDSVTNIGDYAFHSCRGLTNVTFMGNAPTVGYSVFYSVDSTCAASVSPKSTGWGVEIGEKWNGLMLQYWPQVLAAAANDAEVGEIVATFSDNGLAVQVSTVTEYDAFRSWVNVNNLYQPSVVANTNTVVAYLLGAERLFEKQPTIEIGGMAIGAEGDDALSTTCLTMGVSVTVKDGAEMVKCAAEKVAAMFEATSDLGDWDGAAKLTPTVTVADAASSAVGDNRSPMRFRVMLDDVTANRAFLRVKVK